MSNIQMVGDLPILPQSEFEKAWLRRSYLKYCMHVHRGKWKPGRHHVLIANALDDVINGKIKRLMIWMPPRHGKSMEITETFPSYFLGKYPDKRVIEVSYNSAFAEKFGLANRTKIYEFGEDIFGIQVSQEKSSKTNWSIAGHRGGMLSSGLGGAITGEGADLLIIDDPIKNREEADSQTHRANLMREFEATLYTRVQVGGAIIIVMTRWHEEDICGALLKPTDGREPEDWTVLSLPAICESEDDALGRKIGEPLWPEYGYDENWCNRTRRAVGSYTWAGLYQQRPAPLEGGLFKRGLFKFYTKLPDNLNQAVQSWDCTFKEADANDFVAGHVWAKKGPNYYMLDRIHDRMGISDTMLGVETLAAKWPNARAKCVEEAANGAAVIELLSKKIPGLIPVSPMGGKVSRAQAILPYLEAGNIYLPSPTIAPWIHDFIEECASFPNAAHDDDVDAMTQAITQLDLLFGNGGGMIYRYFSDAPEAYLLPRTLLEQRMKDEYGRSQLMSLSVGVAKDNTIYGTSFVATAVALNYAEVFCVASHVCPCNSSPDFVAKELVEFIKRVNVLAGRQPDYAYLGGSDDILYRTAKTAMNQSGLQTAVRAAIDIQEADRIELTLSLMAERKITVSEEDAHDLSEAFMVAQWCDNRSRRSEDGAANTLVLQAFERSIEKHRKYLIS